MTAKEIANTVGKTTAHILKLCQVHEIPFKKLPAGGVRPVAGAKVHPKTERVLKLHKQGLSRREIEERLNMSYDTISNILIRNNCR